MRRPDKMELFDLGRDLIYRWCEMNQVDRPKIIIHPDGKPTFAVCAYYRDGAIYIWPHACASIGMAGRSWSYPGYVVDRTPYGVLAHELAHHVEGAHGGRGGKIAKTWFVETGESPITSYAPNVNEWFAEIFRLFLTNPDLLSILRPKMFKKLSGEWPRLIERRVWKDVLKGAERQIRAAENKIRQVT